MNDMSVGQPNTRLEAMWAPVAYPTEEFVGALLSVDLSLSRFHSLFRAFHDAFQTLVCNNGGGMNALSPADLFGRGVVPAYVYALDYGRQASLSCDDADSRETLRLDLVQIRSGLACLAPRMGRWNANHRVMREWLRLEEEVEEELAREEAEDSEASGPPSVGSDQLRDRGAWWE